MSSYQESYGDKGYDQQTRDSGYKGSDYEVLESGFGGLNAPQVANRTSPQVDLEQSLRLGFIRKVYGILSLQLLLTAAVSAVCVLSDPVREWILKNAWTVNLGLVMSIVLLLFLFCFAKQYPTNMYLLTAWTFVEAYTVGVICAFYATMGQGTIVIQAAGLTMAVFLGLTIFTFQSKIDFSFLGGALFACLWILFLWGLVMLIFGFQQTYLYSLFGAIIFSLYILYDTSQLIHKLDYDEYILASINLYLDIINLFIYILRLLSSRND